MDTCPGIPSNSKVCTKRSGARTSWKTPWNPYSAPSGLLSTNRQRPPGRASATSIRVSVSSRPHQRAMESGSVMAAKTASRGASNVRVMTMSWRPGSATTFKWLMVLFSLGAVLEPEQFLVQAGEAALPLLPVTADPVGDLLQRRGLERAGTPLRGAPADDEPGAFQDLEVFGDRLEAHGERLRQFVDGGLTLRQPGEERSAGRVRECGEGETERVGRHQRIQPFRCSTSKLIRHLWVTRVQGIKASPGAFFLGLRGRPTPALGPVQPSLSSLTTVGSLIDASTPAPSRSSSSAVNKERAA